MRYSLPGRLSSTWIAGHHGMLGLHEHIHPLLGLGVKFLPAGLFVEHGVPSLLIHLGVPVVAAEDGGQDEVVPQLVDGVAVYGGGLLLRLGQKNQVFPIPLRQVDIAGL